MINQLHTILKKIFVLPIVFYRTVISPLTPPACRYQPSCSYYMMQAILKWGIFKGTWMGTKRIFRCHPWSKHDPFDPVPEPEKKIE